MVFGAGFLMREKCYIHLQEEQGGSGELEVGGQPQLSLWEVDKSVEAISETVRGKMMTGKSQHRFRKDKWCPTNLITFCD